MFVELPGCNRADEAAHLFAVADLARGAQHLGLGVEDDDGEHVGLAELVDEGEQRLLHPRELVRVGHRAALVDDEREVDGRQLAAVGGERGAEADLQDGLGGRA